MTGTSPIDAASASGGSHTPAVTVVIPTLGGQTLTTTIEALNQGSVRPAEILVCIPAPEAARVENAGLENVRVIVTERRGQVVQRAEGFRRAAHELVLQLDDDIVLDVQCVERLVSGLQALGNDAAIAPAMMN